jgi:hypothetical protein
VTPHLQICALSQKGEETDIWTINNADGATFKPGKATGRCHLAPTVTVDDSSGDRKRTGVGEYVGQLEPATVRGGSSLKSCAVTTGHFHSQTHAPTNREQISHKIHSPVHSSWKGGAGGQMSISSQADVHTWRQGGAKLPWTCGEGATQHLGPARAAALHGYCWAW